MKHLIDHKQGIQLAGENAALYLRMLSRFPLDPTMDNLNAAFCRTDRQDAFLQAHTLKGLCAQLALPVLRDEADRLCLLLRSDAQLPSSVPETLLSAYALTLEAIAEFTQNA